MTTEYFCSNGRKCVGAPLCGAAATADQAREAAERDPVTRPHADAIGEAAQNVTRVVPGMCPRRTGKLNGH